MADVVISEMQNFLVMKLVKGGVVAKNYCPLSYKLPDMIIAGCPLPLPPSPSLSAIKFALAVTLSSSFRLLGGEVSGGGGEVSGAVSGDFTLVLDNTSLSSSFRLILLIAPGLQSILILVHLTP